LSGITRLECNIVFPENKNIRELYEQIPKN